MKPITILSFIILTGTSRITCSFPDARTDIQHSEYDHYYEMTAKFNPDKTTAVGKYLDNEFHSSDLSFTKGEVDADLTLDDKTTFYMKKSPGYLKIKLDKEKNSEEAYRKVKGVMEAIEEVVK